MPPCFDGSIIYSKEPLPQATQINIRLVMGFSQTNSSVSPSLRGYIITSVPNIQEHQTPRQKQRLCPVGSMPGKVVSLQYQNKRKATKNPALQPRQHRIRQSQRGSNSLSVASTYSSSSSSRLQASMIFLASAAGTSS